ncbi:BolA/IbaG family iron-sulfur metabolism protein [Aestuariicella hydrocarbonica]|uniref:DNA-binding transcriptional regulator BolA n=1 Tax=Pseudomaricurvus hydrocarbonicus TaxID=1470433 RepID=A0A9E5MMU4_9GAMM|nr:BolA/IbaG family iron-sulfur metabolism protein [Aestuariicella hydrocarbonica]NHO67131.1 BolA/IbaG family iron-sulfur metabolism protein [Aestuariicella hydrocarbonica]
MKIQSAIEAKLEQRFSPQYLEVVNESHMHSVPPDSESHFKVVLVCEGFDGVRQVQRHQQVYKVLSDEMDGEVHALALHTYSPQEWQKTGLAPESPQCLGGSKADR